MFYRTDNPIADFNRYDREQSRRAKRLPVCELCGERIYQDDAVCINGSWYCDECLDDCRKDTERGDE